MKKLAFSLVLLVLLLAGCGTVVIGTLTLEPSVTPSMESSTQTPTTTITRTPTTTSTATNTLEIPVLTEEAISTPTQRFTPTAIPTSEIYIYRPDQSNVSDDFIITIASIVNIRAGTGFDAWCIITDGLMDSNCKDPMREVLRKDEVRKVYMIYYDATVEQYWARINPETDQVARWVSVNTLICRDNNTSNKIYCTEFK